jgi:hypothetical protein
MYLLREKYVKNKKPKELDAFILATDDAIKRGNNRTIMLEKARWFFDQYIGSLMTEKEFNIVIKKMKKTITDPGTDIWFREMVDAMLNNDEEIRKSKNRQRMQKMRANNAGFEEVPRQANDGF